jgi:hypothetical protein
MKSKSKWFGIIVLGMILFGTPAVYAGDVQPLPDPAADEANFEAEDDSSFPPPVLGSTTQDFLYTPVTPCRIINTWNAGGPLNTNETRSFLVHGTGGQLASQGGSSGGCIAPRGEPRAVHINVTVVDTINSGYLSAWPYGIAMPLPRTSILNYKPDARDPICNALTVKTGYALAKDINIYALKKTDLIVDVLGYYYDAEPEKIVAVASTGTITGGQYVGDSLTTLLSKTVTIPSNGNVILMGEANFGENFTSGHLDCSFWEDGTRIDSWWWYFKLNIAEDRHASRFYSKTVTPGSKTYYLKCEKNLPDDMYAFNRNLTIQFIKEGM